MKHLPPPRRDNARKHPRNPAQQVAAEAALGGLVRRHVTLHFGFSDSPTGGLLDQQMLVAIVSLFSKISAATLTNAKPAPTLKIFLTSLTRVNAFQTVT
jgi:hypothetical protein